MMWTDEDIKQNRAANLRMLIGRYIQRGYADEAADCTVRLVRVLEDRDEE